MKERMPFRNNYERLREVANNATFFIFLNMYKIKQI